MSRNICKEIKFNQEEQEIMRKHAEKAGKRLGTYIREAAVNGEIRLYNMRQFEHLIMKFQNVVREINDIAKVVNSTQTVCAKDIEDMKKSFNYLDIVFENYLLPHRYEVFKYEPPPVSRKGG